MNAIIVDYDVFAKESRLYIMKDGHKSQYHVSSDLNDMADQIVAIAQEHDIYDVKFHAPLAFIGEANRAIKAAEMAIYSMNKISVEGL